MATLDDMVEHCDRCGEELDLGQIGVCDSCRAIESVRHIPVTGPAGPAFEKLCVAQGAAAPQGSGNPYPAGSAAATWWRRGHAHRNEAMRQRHYDSLHHQMRKDWLQSDNPCWSCGAPVLPSEKHQLLSQSLRCLEQPASSSRSVDLGDHAYIAQLDAYEQSLKGADIART